MTTTQNTIVLRQSEIKEICAALLNRDQKIHDAIRNIRNIQNGEGADEAHNALSKLRIDLENTRAKLVTARSVIVIPNEADE